MFVDTIAADNDAAMDEAATATAGLRGSGKKRARSPTRVAQDTPLRTVEATTTTMARYSYDPRFLVFEFTWNIVLRRTQVGVRIRAYSQTHPLLLLSLMFYRRRRLAASVQVELVNDILASVGHGNVGRGACVKQMLMGGGKTTVVSPLLTLILGDGKHLVLQVVPPALLEFSRGVLRSTVREPVVACMRVCS